MKKERCGEMAMKLLMLDIEYFLVDRRGGIPWAYMAPTGLVMLSKGLGRAFKRLNTKIPYRKGL